MTDPTPRLDTVLATSQVVAFRAALVDLVEDVLAGLMLSQILYWTPRATIEREGAFWIAKRDPDWWDEIRLTVDQARRARKILTDSGLVETRRWKFDGTPTIHYRVVPDAIEEALDRFGPGPESIRDPAHFDSGQNPNPSGPEPESFPSPETTPETTPETPGPARGEEGFHQDADRLCDLLADLVHANGSKRPNVTARWRDAARLLLTADGPTDDGWDFEKAETIVRWCQADEFWRANVLSMPTLREKFDQLRLARNRSIEKTRGGAPRDGADALREYAEGGVLR